MNRKIGKIRDVAKETGLSIATISRVMNGAKNVSPATQERVLDACRKLDYLPNPAARALSTNKSRTIAAIIPTIEHSVFAKYIAAIEQTLSERGYSLVLAISNGKEDLELAAARKLLGMGAEAFILSGSAHSPELTGMFARRGVPCVYTSIWEPHSEVPTIGYDNFMLASDAVAFLADRGHGNIAVIHGPLDESDRTRARRSGASAAADAAGADGIALRFFETSLDVAGGKAAIREAKRDFGACTAALCFSDVLALGVYFGLSESGVKIPDEFSVMGFDNLDWSGTVVPSLTTINLPAREMGVNVASQLTSFLETGEAVVPTELAGHVIERDSVARIE